MQKMAEKLATGEATYIERMNRNEQYETAGYSTILYTCSEHT